MKRTAIDKLVGYFSPQAELRRLRSRAERDMALRAYDIAQTYSTSDWVSATKNSANSDTKAALEPGRQKARALAQNNPYGLRAVDVIVANTVGAGIVPNIRGKNSTQTKKLNELWVQWAESTACDFNGRHDFYGLQSLIMRSTVEAGEGLGLKKFTKFGPKIQLLEPDFIVTAKDEGRVIQGIELDGTGQRVKYHLYKTHPGDKNSSQESITVPASDVTHVYRQVRPGQMRGVTWAHAVVEKLKDFDDYQSATLIRQKIAACFGGFITTPATDSLLSAADLKAKRAAEFSMEPATVRYLGPGEDFKYAAPPGVEGYSDFSRETLRAVASGFGISYESLTGDYSQSNYSSSRMGREEMRQNIDSWRWQMLIPQFCNPAFGWFLEWAALQGINVDGATVQWVPPAPTQIDPTKEGEALKRDVRNGFKSWGEAVRELGRDPETVLSEIVEWNKRFDDAQVSLDTDPRRMSNVGFAQAGDSLSKLSEAQFLQDQSTSSSNEGNSEAQNQENAPGSSDPGSAQ